MSEAPEQAEPVKKCLFKYSGSLDHLEYFDVTPCIGREYPKAKIRDILYADNWEAQIRDLAITICERCVVFFRAPQDDLSIQDQKRITLLLGELTGRPPENGLHVHPLFRDPNQITVADGPLDKELYVINRENQLKLYQSTIKLAPRHLKVEPSDLVREWHSDLLYEECPADFSFLRMEETPASGGDTVWASGYELYDRMSPSFRSYLETLSAICPQPIFKTAAEAGGYEIMSPRGSPLNCGDSFAPIHPVIRTHPVTGWKSVFAGIGLHVGEIQGVFHYEDIMIKDYFTRLLTRNHDLVARMHWTKQACAIWSNPCTLHAATPDLHLSLNVESNRRGVRASGVGGKPYLDPKSISRRQALGLPLV